MNIQLEKDAFMPARAHPEDAGLDLHSPVDTIVPAGTAGLLVSKSGLYIRHGLSSTGLIDVGYTGSIVVKLYNHSGVDYYVSRGDKVSQLVIIPVLLPELCEVPELLPTPRGNGGFGSTGK